jgi:hypothetical protein
MWWLLLAPATLILYLSGGFSLFMDIVKIITKRTMTELREFEGYGTIKRNGILGEISYLDDGKKYTIVFPLPRGPSKYYRVTSNIGDDVKDVTDEIKSYSGPGHNFHGISTTPVMLGYPKLTFYTLKGERVFYEDDTIAL